MATREDLRASMFSTQCDDGLNEIVTLPDAFYQDRLSTVSKSRKPSPIWDLFSVEAQPGMLSMLAGKPNPATFPFEHITLGIKSPESTTTGATTATTTELVLRDEDLAVALQYNMTAGIPELVNWVTHLMEEAHCADLSAASNSGWRISLGPGSQDLLYKSFCALLNPGDTIIVEGPTYPTIIPLLDAMGCHYAIVDSDEEGMSASSLDHVLSTWGESESTRGKPFPKVLYTVPFGSNPAGITTSYRRRIEILQLVRHHDLIIIEDDPYYFLYYGDAPRPPSYFYLDRHISGSAKESDEPSITGAGRVLRLDSFSKIISAGFRLGWVTGPSVLLTAIERHNASTVVQPSSLSQMVILKLLQTWGLQGFMEHAERTATFYRQRRDAMLACLERHFGTSGTIAEWKVPDASMFFWVKLHLNPGGGDSTPMSGGDSTSFVRDSAVARGVLVLPGASAFPDARRTGCVRLSFSLVSDEEMEEAVRRLKEAVVESGGGVGREPVKMGSAVKGKDEDVVVAVVAVPSADNLSKPATKEQKDQVKVKKAETKKIFLFRRLSIASFKLNSTPTKVKSNDLLASKTGLTHKLKWSWTKSSHDQTASVSESSESNMVQ